MDNQLKKCQFIRHLDAETSNVESFTVDGEPRIIQLDVKDSLTTEKVVVAEYATGVCKICTYHKAQNVNKIVNKVYFY